MHSKLIYLLLCILSIDALILSKPDLTLRHRVKLLPGRSPKTAGHPFVLIPGDGGAQIYAKLVNKTHVPRYLCSSSTSDYFNIWLNLELFAPYVIDCWIENFRLLYNVSLGKSNVVEGVNFKIPDWGNTTTVEWLDPSYLAKGRFGHYFATIVENAIHWGYKRGKDARGAPYDWRFSPVDNVNLMSDIRDLIEDTYRINGNRKVVVIAHSMGNPVFINFINSQTQAWKDTFIKSYVGISPPLGGSAKIMLLYASGYNFDHYSIVLNPLKCREMQRSFTSSVYLMPVKGPFNESYNLIETPTRNYTVDDYQQFFEDIAYPIGWEMFKTNGQLLQQIEAPNVETHCIFGTGVPTPNSFIYTGTQFPDTQPTFVLGKGDGTVNEDSLKVCTNFAEQQSKPVKQYIVTDSTGEHNEILKNQNVVEYIRKVLYDEI